MSGSIALLEAGDIGDDPTGRFSHPHLPEDIISLRHPRTGVVWLMTPEYAAELGILLIRRSS